jgi:hypothetical protein
VIRAEGLDELVADLRDAPGRVQAAARAVIERAAVNVKDDARRLSSGIGHAPHYPESITYDVRHTGRGDIDAEIGPDKDRRQGALGNIFEYGTSKNAPLAHLGPALDLETPRLVRAFAELDDGLGR